MPLWVTMSGSADLGRHWPIPANPKIYVERHRPTMASNEPLVSADGKVGLQGNKEGATGVLRTRLPADVLHALGAEDGHYIRWEVYDDPKSGPYVQGYLISAEDASPRDLIAERQAAAAQKPAAKKTAKKGATKKAAKKGGNGADPFAGAFGEEEDDEDDGGIVMPTPTRRKPPAPIGSKSKPAPVTGTPTKQAQAAVTRRPPAPAGGRQPRVAGPLPKPSAKRGGGGVRYSNLPED